MLRVAATVQQYHVSSWPMVRDSERERLHSLDIIQHIIFPSVFPPFLSSLSVYGFINIDPLSIFGFFSFFPKSPTNHTKFNSTFPIYIFQVKRLLRFNSDVFLEGYVQLRVYWDERHQSGFSVLVDVIWCCVFSAVTGPACDFLLVFIFSRVLRLCRLDFGRDYWRLLHSWVAASLFPSIYQVSPLLI